MANISGCSELADYEWLTGPNAASWLAETAASSEPLHTLIARLRRGLSSPRAHLVVELVELRRRAAAKFAAADRMFFTPRLLEQATDEWIAAHKAARFSLFPRIADLCSGIGGDLLALAGHGSVLGVDRDPIAILLASANLRTVLLTVASNRITFETGDVESFRSETVTAWHLDPDRRSGGRRTSSPLAGSPGPAAIERLLSSCPHAAIKFAPAARVPPDWETRSELEWISRGGECRQLVAWLGDLARAPGQRTATVVRLSGDGIDSTSITGLPNRPYPVVPALDRFVFDVDPAVLVAHLKGELAAKFELSALSRGATYLTGPQSIHNAMLDCFEVQGLFPLRIRDIGAHLRQRKVGQIEIKKRGLDIDPQKLRRRLSPRGDEAATLLITPIAGRPAVILARRITPVSG
jgi:hypothetical protein